MGEDIGINGGALLQSDCLVIALKHNHGEARKTIEDQGLTNADGVLAHLGFTVKWKGLDPNEARIGADQSFS